MALGYGPPAGHPHWADCSVGCGEVTGRAEEPTEATRGELDVASFKTCLGSIDAQGPGQEQKRKCPKPLMLRAALYGSA